jgi:hypothetical protein
VLADVAGNLIAQFAEALEADLVGGSSAATTAPTAETITAASQPAAADSVDLLKVVAVPMAKRAAPAIAALAAGGVVGFLLGRRRSRRTRAQQLPEELIAALSRLLS